MDLPLNKFKRDLLAGKQQIGLWVSLASPYCTEILAGSGFDWLLIDTEHSPNEVDTTLAHLQAAAPYPPSCVVRPAWNDKVLAKRFLDIGAQTLLVPYISTVAEAQEAVRAVRYPPRGIRGVAGFTRAGRYARVKDYVKRAEAEVCLLLQIETREGLDNLEKIAKVDGVDGVFIGPSDLAAGLGHLGDPGHAEVQSAIKDGIARISACGKAPGILAVDDASAQRFIDWGSRFTAVGMDGIILARETTALAARFKK
jgi:4-hydroxy-2-oxoheptanedioate aldolase